VRKVALKMSVSVDGFVGGRNGEVDWIFKSLDEGATAWSVATLTARLMKRRVPVWRGARAGVPPFDAEDRAT
jgi:hypothetical protein